MIVEDYDPWTRFRVYRLRRGQLREIAGCSTEDAIGLMLVTLHSEGEFGDDPIGILDTGPREEGRRGVWLINPYTRSRSG